MAPETKGKKRKSGGAVASPDTKKLKKADAPAPVAEEQPTPVKASKKPKKDAAAKQKEDDASIARTKPSRKRASASDFLDGAEEETKAADKPTPKKSKKAKKEDKVDEEPAVVEKKKPAPAAAKKAKKEEKMVEEPAAEEKKPAAAAKKAASSKKRKAAEAPAPIAEEPADDEVAVDGSDDAESEDEDDQTKALLKGFESDEDEQDGEDEGDLSKLPALPDAKKLSKKLKKVDGNSTPGVIYIGRVPHGFYEHQMKAYFAQFGAINRVRLARNKKTGRSKHYAFIEFANDDVAKIVAETMDKYLMFGHILQVRHIPQEQVHPELFKGSNKRFKAAPRNKMQGRHLRLGMDREAWDRRIDREEKRRKTKEEKLKEMDYEFDAPAIKATSKVPKHSEAVTAEAEAEETPKALAEKPHNEEDKEIAEAMESVKKTRKSKRASTGAAKEEETKENEPVKVKATKAKKDEPKPAKAEKEAKPEKVEKKASKPKAKKTKASA